MSHDPADFQLVSEPAVTVEKGRTGVVGSGDLFASEKVAHAWVRKLDQMDNDQLADVLGFIFCKLCKR